MLTTVLYKVNLLGPIYFDICHATESRFMLVEFVRMSDAVRCSSPWCWNLIIKSQITFRRKRKRSTVVLVCSWYIYISLCAGNCDYVSFHFWVCLQVAKCNCYLRPVRSSICPHGKTRPPPDWFSWYLIIDYF